MVRVFIVYEVAPPARPLRRARRALPQGRGRHVPSRHDLRDADGSEPEFGYYAEFEFPDRDAFKAAASTPEFGATAKDAMAMGIPFKVFFANVE